MGDHRQVRTAHGRAQIGVGRGATHTVLHGHVHGAETFLHVAVAVFGLDVARLRTGFDPGTVQRVFHVVAVGGMQRSRLPAIAVATRLVALGTLEVRQAVAIAPAFGTQGFPLVKVQRMATDIHQAVDRRRTAQHLAPWAVNAPAVEVGLRLGFVAPVVLLGVHRDRECARHLDHYALVTAAEFQDQHRGGRIFAQAVGQHTTCRACANDDVVVFLRSHFLRGHSLRGHSYLPTVDSVNTGCGCCLWVSVSPVVYCGEFFSICWITASSRLRSIERLSQ